MNKQMHQDFKKHRAKLAGQLVQGEDWPSAYRMADELLSWSSFEAGWLASRATLVIELPTVGPEPEPPEEAMDDSYMDAHHAKIRMRNACFKAIEAAGLKVTS